MRRDPLRLLLIGLCGVGVLLAVRLAARPLVRVALPPAVRERQHLTTRAPRTSVDSLARPVIDRDPFRFSRRPAAAEYDPLRMDQQTVAAPKPVLRLGGIIWEGGHDPVAVIEGLPGTDGPRVVKMGDVVAGLRVRRIAPDLVRIEDADTTWVLKAKGS